MLMRGWSRSTPLKSFRFETFPLHLKCRKRNDTRTDVRATKSPFISTNDSGEVSNKMKEKKGSERIFLDLHLKSALSLFAAFLLNTNERPTMEYAFNKL